jgi:NAD(P)-dependent dehydrogenase (short-subunit alcohol dehydrogenase family)
MAVAFAARPAWGTVRVAAASVLHAIRLRNRLDSVSMDLGLQGLRVIVTAGASGIGLAIARAFVREGGRVHVCDVDEAALDALAASDPAIGRAYCDVAQRGEVAHFFEEALAALGGLDCLVNNAGIAGPTGRIEEIDPLAWDRCLAVDLTGQFNCIRHAVRPLRQSANASIVNVSSLAGRLGFPLRTPYAAAKWGVIGLTRSLAAELGADGIRVNALLPGIVAGDRQRRVLEAKAQARGIGFEDMERLAFSNTSIKEYVTAEQLADLVLFVTSAHGRTISGQALSVCGDTNMLA